MWEYQCGCFNTHYFPSLFFSFGSVHFFYQISVRLHYECTFFFYLQFQILNKLEITMNLCHIFDFIFFALTNPIQLIFPFSLECFLRLLFYLSLYTVLLNQLCYLESSKLELPMHLDYYRIKSISLWKLRENSIWKFNRKQNENFIRHLIESISNNHCLYSIELSDCQIFIRSIAVSFELIEIQLFSTSKTTIINLDI